jgi:hypothetical protein
MLSDIAARVLDAVGIQKPESGCRRILPRRGSRPADRGRPSHPGEPTRAAGDRLWGRRGSRSPPRCHPNLDDTEPRHTVAAPGSVERALADRCHLLVQHPGSGLHRRTTLVICGDHDRAVPPANKSATCGPHPRRPPHHDPGRTRSAKARPGRNGGPNGGTVSRFGYFDGGLSAEGEGHIGPAGHGERFGTCG